MRVTLGFLQILLGNIILASSALIHSGLKDDHLSVLVGENSHVVERFVQKARISTFIESDNIIEPIPQSVDTLIGPHYPLSTLPYPTTLPVTRRPKSSRIVSPIQ